MRAALGSMTRSSKPQARCQRKAAPRNAETIAAMNEVDSEILRLLRANGRMSWRDLGAAVGLSANAAADRVRRLRQAGVITGFVALVDPAAGGRRLEALVGVTLAADDRLRRLRHSRGQARARARVPPPQRLTRLPAASRLHRHGRARRAATHAAPPPRRRRHRDDDHPPLRPTRHMKERGLAPFFHPLHAQPTQETGLAPFFHPLRVQPTQERRAGRPAAGDCRWRVGEACAALTPAQRGSPRRLASARRRVRRGVCGLGPGGRDRRDARRARAMRRQPPVCRRAPANRDARDAPGGTASSRSERARGPGHLAFRVSWSPVRPSGGRGGDRWQIARSGRRYAHIWGLAATTSPQARRPCLLLCRGKRRGPRQHTTAGRRPDRPARRENSNPTPDTRFTQHPLYACN